jgi:hypothetical protein
MIHNLIYKDKPINSKINVGVILLYDVVMYSIFSTVHEVVRNSPQNVPFLPSLLLLNIHIKGYYDYNSSPYKIMLTVHFVKMKTKLTFHTF